MASGHKLKPAAELAVKASKPFPNESQEYRQARTALLVEEIELRRQIERVAAQRRTLPPGGEVSPDYTFIGEDGKRVTLPEMFGDKNTLVAYLWMYGPERERPCPMCTAFIGAMDTPARDIRQRVAMAVIGRSPIERQKAFKQERGWRNLPFYTSVDDGFMRDYRALASNGDEWPALLVFARKHDVGKDRAHLFWASELGGTEDPGQDARGAPDPTPLWNILDLTPEGRGTNWYPKLDYAAE
jgi:predicted dithiol-disulfide oxidoreductase (DUF899 family)